MTDLTALTEITTPTTDDLVYVVDAPAGAKNPRKCSIANLVASASINADKITSGTLPLARLTGTITTAELSASAGIVNGQLAGSIAQSKITNLSTDLSGKSPTAGNTSLTTVGAIGTGTWESTDVAVAHGGTGSSTASAARTALGVAIGSDVQIYNANTALTTNTLNDFAAPNADLALGTQKITGLVAGVADSDAATKGQVDAAQAGLDAKSACRVATTADVTTWVYNNGAKTLTASGNGVVTIDGIPLLISDRILVKDQSPANENGLYYVSTVGTASATQVLTRTTDADEDDEVTSGLYTFITEGTANGSTGFVLVTADPITVGNTLLSFSQFSGLAQLNAGTGITKTGNTINVDVGISNDELPQFTTGAVDDDFLRISGTKIEGLNAGEVLTAIGASPTAGNGSLVTVGALSTGGSITSGFGAIDNGASAITTTGTITGGKLTVDNLTIDANKIESINAGGDIELAPKTTGVVTVIGNTNDGAITLNCTSNSHGQTIKSQPHSATATNTMLLPLGANSTLVSLVSTDTLTNKTLTAPVVNVGSDATGDIYYRNASGVFTRLAKPGTPAGEVLTFAASATIPSWAAAAGGAASTLLDFKYQATSYTTPSYTARTVNDANTPIQLWVKDIDANNQGIYIRIKKNAAYEDVQIG